MKDRVSEEVMTVGLRKHGVGEILPDEEDDLTKTAASDGEWTAEDQAELEAENKG